MPRRRISEDETALWQAVAKTAKPLKRRRKPQPAPGSAAASTAPLSAKPAKPKPPAPAKAHSPTPKPVSPPAPLPGSPPGSSPGSPPVSQAAELAHGGSVGIDKRQAERFRRGKTPIEGRIDLHGRTQQQAHDDLTPFLTRAAAAGKRCVLVITGKGMTGGKIGILRENAPRWLNEPGLRKYILAFDHAEPRHGGEGALYVLLKRKK